MPTVATFVTLINSLLPEPQAGLLSGILFGTKASLEVGLYNALITTGTLHIIALSGTNITILTGIINSILLRFMNRKIAGLCSIGAIIGYVVFVGPSPSIVRAAIMGSVSIIGSITGRQRNGLFGWCIAATGMLVVSPSLIADLSFQLSALASLGMLLFDSSKAFQHCRGKVLDSALVDSPRPFVAFLRSLWSYMYPELHTTLSAQVCTIPLIVFVFGRMSIISPVTNLLIGCTIPVIMVLGFLMIFVSGIWIGFSHIVSWVVWVWLSYVVFVVEKTARIPWASIGL